MRPAIIVGGLIMVLVMAAAPVWAHSFYKEIKICANSYNVWVDGLDPKKPIHTAANCVKGETKVNWQVDVTYDQDGVKKKVGDVWGNGFYCKDQGQWTYKNTYSGGNALQYYGQVGCVLIKITQD